MPEIAEERDPASLAPHRFSIHAVEHLMRTRERPRSTAYLYTRSLLQSSREILRYTRTRKLEPNRCQGGIDPVMYLSIHVRKDSEGITLRRKRPLEHVTCAFANVGIMKHTNKCARGHGSK